MRLVAVTFHVMILSVLLNVMSGGVLAGEVSFAAKRTTQKSTLPQSHLGTDFRFDDMTVHGTHQSPFGASSVVEGEKDTPTLIDYRKNFADRVVRSETGR